MRLECGSSRGITGAPPADQREPAGRSRARPGTTLRDSSGSGRAMIPIHDDLLTVLDAVEIVSPSRYVLLGEPRELPIAVGGRFLAGGRARPLSSPRWRTTCTSGSTCDLPRLHWPRPTCSPGATCSPPSRRPTPAGVTGNRAGRSAGSKRMDGSWSREKVSNSGLLRRACVSRPGRSDRANPVESGSPRSCAAWSRVSMSPSGMKRATRIIAAVGRIHSSAITGI